MTAPLATLIQAVETADSAPRLVVAVQHLAAAEEVEAIPSLIAALSYNNPGAAVAAVDGLVKLGQVTVPALLELLDLHNYTARSWAIRALACIGDPRGLVTLLEVTATDFAPSVRRAAVRGLGLIQWQMFPSDLLEIAWAETLKSLLFVAHQDEEWVVRYSAVVGLQNLAMAMQAANHPTGYDQIMTQLATMADQEPSLSVRGRIWLARQKLQQSATDAKAPHPDLSSASCLSALISDDWQVIAEQLHLLSAPKAPTAAKDEQQSVSLQHNIHATLIGSKEPTFSACDDSQC
jgi:phycocyanobilin lyase beta subunit